MTLLAQELLRAGLAFVSAKALQGHGGFYIEEIVCATQGEADLVDAWALREGYTTKEHVARVATAEELIEAKRQEELL